MTFTGEGPNACECGTELPGTNHWSDDQFPFATCSNCGLHYVLEDGHVLIYIMHRAGLVDRVAVVEDDAEALARFRERSDMLRADLAPGYDAPEPELLNDVRAVA